MVDLAENNKKIIIVEQQRQKIQCQREYNNVVLQPQ